MIIAIDTETYKYDQSKGEYKPIKDTREFVLGMAITDKRKEYYFTDPEEMYKWIKETVQYNKERKRRTYIYAHNAEYDWYAIAKNHLLDEENKHILFNPLMVIHNEKGFILDTMSFYKMKLKDAGIIINKQKMELPMNPKTIEEIKPYIKRDTEIVLEIVLKLKRDLKKLGFSPKKIITAGQIAMTTFLTYTKQARTQYTFTTYNEKTKRREVIKTQHAEKIREAYRGGDNQANQTGKWNNCTLIDINGLYADIMRKMPFPQLDTETYNEKPTKEMLQKYIEKTRIGIARITIKSPRNNDLPILPITWQGQQIHPKGNTITGTWTYHEIQTATQEGYEIINCEWTIRWKEATINPLKGFIEELYEIEKNAKIPEEKVPIKLIRNNLAGKFAQYRKNKDYKIVIREEVMKWIEQGYKTTSKYENKYVLVKETETYNPTYTNPIISVMITSEGRIRLHNELKKIPDEDRIYWDTDSIIYKGKHHDKFEISKELGDWKIEKDEDGITELKETACKVLGEKRYYIGNRVKISGVGKNIENKYAIEAETTVQRERMYGLLEALKTGEYNKVGSFSKEEIEMKPHKKNELPYPEKIIQED